MYPVRIQRFQELASPPNPIFNLSRGDYISSQALHRSLNLTTATASIPPLRRHPDSSYNNYTHKKHDHREGDARVGHGVAAEVFAGEE